MLKILAFAFVAMFFGNAFAALSDGCFVASRDQQVIVVCTRGSQSPSQQALVAFVDREAGVYNCSRTTKIESKPFVTKYIFRDSAVGSVVFDGGINWGKLTLGDSANGRAFAYKRAPQALEGESRKYFASDACKRAK